MKRTDLLQLFTVVALTSVAADATTLIRRRELLTAQLPGDHIDRIDMKEVTLAPGQATPYHMHPGGVVGYILEGSVLFQTEGEPEKMLRRGSVFFEAPGKPTLKFSNASATQSCRFIACYPLHGEQPLIVIL
jgi:quercetin dioxygenase-like cupin family protein